MKYPLQIHCKYLTKKQRYHNYNQVKKENKPQRRRLKMAKTDA